MKRDFTRTRAALAAYDALDKEFEQSGQWSNKVAWEKYVQLDEAAKAVGRAFIQDTADINSPDKAILIRPNAWLRKMVTQ